MDWWVIVLLLFFLLILLLAYVLSKNSKVREISASSEIQYLKDAARDIAPEFRGSIEETDEGSRSEGKKKIYIQRNLSRDTLLLILLHELAHCLVVSTEHDASFQQKFLELLDRSRAKGYLKDMKNVFQELNQPKKTKCSFRKIPRRNI